MPLFDRFRRDRSPDQVRSPAVATNVRSTRVGLASLSTYDDELVTRKMWLANVYVDAAIRAIADDLARMPFRAGHDPDKRADHNPKAPLAMLLGPPPGGPNLATSPRQLWKWTIAHRVALGRFAWELELDNKRRPVNIWPLVTRKLTPVPSDQSQWFASFDYATDTKGTVNLAADQVVYGWVPHPDDFRLWVSPLQAARLDIDVMVTQNRFDAAFIRNGNIPANLVVHEEFATDEDTEAFRAQFTSEHQGPDNAGKTAFAARPFGQQGNAKDALEVIKLGLSPKDTAALERYESKLRAALVALGVPLGRLGVLSGRTYSNADREMETYWQSTVWSLAEELADVVNMQLAPRLGDGSYAGWFDPSGIPQLRPKPLLAVPSLVEAVKAELISKDEGREEIGYSGAAPDSPDADAATEPDGDEADPADRQGPRRAQRATTADVHGLTGSMIALAPADPDALTVPDGDPADQLHVTLKYLGKAALWDSDQRRTVNDIARAWAAQHGPFTATVSGVGILGDENADVLHLDVPGLAAARASLNEQITDLDAPDGHPGLADTYDTFVPHLTVGYQLDDLPEHLIGTTIDLNVVRVHWAGDVTETSLGTRTARPSIDTTAVRRAARRSTRARQQAAARNTARQQRARAEIDAHIDTLEQLFDTAIAAHLATQRAAVLNRLTGNRGVASHRKGELRADAVFDDDYWTRRLIAETEGLFRQVVAMAGGRLAGDVGLSFDLHAPNVDAFIRSRANQLAGPVTQTTYRAIQDALVEGVQAGEGIPQLAARIEHLFDVTWAGRSTVIARTEVISAYNGGTTTAALMFGPGVVTGMQWLATGDARTRQAHRLASGQTIRLGEAFLVDGERLAYPGDPAGSPENTVQCRCTTLPLTQRDWDDAGGRSVPAGSVELREVQRLVVAAALGELEWDQAIRELVAS